MTVERPLIRVLALIVLLAVLLAVVVYAGHHSPALVGHGPSIPPDPWRVAG